MPAASAAAARAPQHDHQDQRGDHGDRRAGRVVARPGCVATSRRRGRPAGPGDRVAQLLDRLVGGGGARRRVEHDVDLGDVSVRVAGLGRGDPGDAGGSVCDRCAGGRAGEDGDRFGGPGRERPGQGLLPATASGSVRNSSVCTGRRVMPGRAEREAERAARAATPTTPGRRRPRSPMRPQTWPSRASSPTRGTNGQNRPRPKTTSAAGSTTSPESSATTTPMAAATPRPRRLLLRRAAG